jgi:MarR family transcriptional regulator for hemolysin
MIGDMPGPPVQQPIGMQLARAARAVGQEFDRVLAEAGGSAPTWQVLLLIRSRQWGTQSELAERMGITAATLTHHLAGLEQRGLVRRWREDSNRRVQRVELTETGIELFDRLRAVAQRHDERLRSGLGEERARQLGELLQAMQAVVGERTARRAGV